MKPGTVPRPGTWLLGSLLLGLVLWWLCYVPYSGRRLLSAIPYDAQFVSAHASLAERWTDVASNPAMRSLLSSMGVSPDRLDDWTQDEQLRDVLQKADPKEILCAYVPQAGRGREPAWMVAAWVGARSHAVRWLAPLLDLPEAERKTLRGNRVLWRLPVPGLGEDMHLFVVPEEGMVLACIARDEDAMMSMLHCFDGHAPSLASTHRDDDPVTWLLRNNTDDRGWVQMKSRGLVGRRGNRWLFEVSGMSSDALDGRLRVPYETATNRLVKRTAAERAEWQHILRGLPQGALVIPWSQVASLCRRWHGAWLDRLVTEVHELGGRSVGLFLLGGEHSGRLFGVRVPALVLAVTLSAPDEVSDRTALYLDALNTNYQLGLFPAEEYIGERRVFSVASSLSNMYGGLGDDERVSYTVLGNTLVVASSVEPLRRIVAGFDWDGDGVGGPQPWNIGELESGELWFDLVDGLETVRKGMFAYTVSLMAKNTDASQRHFETLRDAKAWLQALAPLQAMHVSAGMGEPGWLDVQVRCGPAEAQGSL